MNHKLCSIDYESHDSYFLILLKQFLENIKMMRPKKKISMKRKVLIIPFQNGIPNF